jgi:hypothetical protein
MIALSLPTIVGGCSTLPDRPTSTAVQIPRDCEDLASPVPYPDPALNLKPKIALAQHRAALGNANTKLLKTRTCLQHQRERFAKGN